MSYKITEITYSVREEISESSDDTKASTCTTKLIAHVIYEIEETHESRAIESELQTLSIKTYDSTGHITSVVNTPLTYTTVDAVKAQVASDIESDIEDYNYKNYYNAHIKNSLATMQVNASLFDRDSKTGLSLFNN